MTCTIYNFKLPSQYTHSHWLTIFFVVVTNVLLIIVALLPVCVKPFQLTVMQATKRKRDIIEDSDKEGNFCYEKIGSLIVESWNVISVQWVIRLKKKINFKGTFFFGLCWGGEVVLELRRPWEGGKLLEMKKWSLQWTQFLKLLKEAWKKIQDFNGVWTHDFAILVRCSTNWAMKPLTLGAGQLWVHMFLWKKWVLMIYEINHVWTAEMKWKWRNDRRSERNLCNCVKKPEKNSGLQRGLNPWPRDSRCDALPTELWTAYWLLYAIA